MSVLYEYQNEKFYFHHSIDNNPCSENFPMHAHEMHEIFYFISGIGKFSVEGKIYPLEPGSLLIMRSSEAHKLEISPEKPYERICIHFSPELIRAMDPEMKLLQAFNDRLIGHYNLYNQKSIRSSYIFECLNGIICSTQDDYFKQLSIKSNIFPILLEIHKSFLNIHQKIHPYTYNDSIRQIIDYINDNISTELSLEKLASHFFISKSYLNRRFRQVTGSTVWEYITIKRLLLARQLIRFGTPATEVCQTCGFYDYSAFFRAYKKHFLVSPGEDRPN